MKKLNKTREKELWKAYKEQDSKSAQEELILSYVPLVKHIVGRIIINLPNKFEFGDLVNYGLLGLMDAMDRFNLKRGVKFSTYAVPRIKGAIYDEVRKLDWVPQGVRRKSKKLTNTYIELEKRLKRSPTDKEVRKELGLNKDEFEKLLSDVNVPENVSLEGIVSSTGGNKLRLKDLIKGSKKEEPDNIFSYNEMKRILGEAINKLPKKEKLVISLYYYEGLTLTEIGEVMDLTTARISQLHTKSIFRLRGYLSRQKNQLVG